MLTSILNTYDFTATVKLLPTEENGERKIQLAFH